MRLTGQNAELFDAFSKVAAKAYKNTHLLSCSVLSKAPNYGNILERYSKKELISFPTLSQHILLFFRYLAANIGHFCFLLMARLFWSLGEQQSPSSYFSTEKPLLTIDIFALLPRIATERNVEDYYLHGLAEQAEKAGFFSFYLYRMYGSRNPKTVYQAIQCIQRSGKGIPDICLLSFTDWFVLFFHLFAYLPAHRRLLCSIKKHIAEKKKHIVETKNTQGSLPEEYILQALYDTMGENIMSGELSRLAGKRLAEKLSDHKNAVVVSWYENQTVNKAFYSGVNECRKALLSSESVPSTQFIGAQLLIWPEELLNNHPDDAEIALGIVPDSVVVNGSWFLPEQSRQHYVVGPALRYKKIFSFRKQLEEKKGNYPSPEEGNNLYSTGKNNASTSFFEEKKARLLAEQSAHYGEQCSSSLERSKDSNPLLVLLSYHPEETKRVLQLVLPLADKGHALCYKFHPATAPDDYLAFLPKDPVFAEKDLYLALQGSSAVIGSGSGALAEAVALGIPALTVEKSGELCLNYLPDFGQGILWEKVENESDIEPALAQLAKQKNTASYVHSVREFTSLLFAEPTEERSIQAFALRTK